MRKRGMALVCAASLLLTGCGAVIPEMTDEESKLIGEYAAITLLKYDADSRSRLVDLTQIEQEPEAPAGSETPEAKEDQPQKTPGISDTPVIDNRGEENNGADSMESFLELPEGVSVVYTGYKLCQSYPEEENQYFVLDATEGKELFVLRFNLQNNSGAAQEFDLMHRKDNYRVTINGSYARTALPTMLTNDLSAYMGTIPDGGTEEVVLLVEVEPEQVEVVNTIALRLKNETKTYTIQLQ